jgi:hypothetical protein
MVKSKTNITNRSIACNGATIAMGAVFAYSIVVMIYTIIRSSSTIYSIMPTGERNEILLANGISVAYSVAVFSILFALISSITGAIAAVILEKMLLYFNPQFIFRKAILVSCITASALLITVYMLLHAVLNEWMTFNYPETFLFWFLFPAAVFLIVCIIGGSKMNEILNRQR